MNAELIYSRMMDFSWVFFAGWVLVLVAANIVAFPDASELRLREREPELRK